MTNLTPDDAQPPFRTSDETTPSAGQTASPKQMLGEAGRAVKQEAQQFASTAQERARSEVDKRKSTASRTLTDVAEAIRKAGDELDQRNQEVGGRMIHQTADTLENFSRTLTEKGPDELLETVRDYGRRNPAAFIGGAVLIGLMIGRFARASSQEAQGMGQQGLHGAARNRRPDVSWSQATGAGDSFSSQTGVTGGIAGEGGSDEEVSGDLYRDDLRSGGMLNEGASRSASDVHIEDERDTGDGRTRGSSFNPEV